MPRADSVFRENLRMNAASVSPRPTPSLSSTQVLACGAAIVTPSMGARDGFGLWLAPITMSRGWPRETFAFALAIQNLAWGLAGPIVGMLANRYGAYKVLAASGLLYALGMAVMAYATSALFTLGAGLFIGVARPCCQILAGIYLLRALAAELAARVWSCF